MGDKHTKSSTFVRGMLGYEFDSYGDNYHNTYVIMEPDRKIVISFNKPVKIEKLEKDECFVKKQQIGSKFVYIFNVPSEFKEDMDLYIDGKYSKMSKKCKDTILGCFYYFPSAFKIIDQVLNPSTGDRNGLEKVLGVKLPEDCEIYDSPTLDEEVYNEEVLN